MKVLRVLSGMRPTGKLHLGHLVGTLNKWCELQEHHQCFYMVADYHALTTDYMDTSNLKTNIQEMVLEWLSVGIDPRRSVIFLQSSIKEHTQLSFLLSLFVPLSLLIHNPTYKEQKEQLMKKKEQLNTYGFLGYPVLQAADILLYCADLVPVGEDQLPHIEIVHKIARRFNSLYKKIFPIPKAILTDAARLPGLDGRKMSKSYGNCIYLTDDEQMIRKKINKMVTDPVRARRDDPGQLTGVNGQVCTVFKYHTIYNPNNLRQIIEECSSAQRGCVDCKRQLTQLIIAQLSPLKQKKESLEKEKDIVWDILKEGNQKAKKIASQTMELVFECIGLKKL